METFIDEVRENPNKMYIKVLSQTADTILAEITPAYKVKTPGTPVNADRMNDLVEAAERSDNNSTIAKSTAIEANNTANSADAKATTALTNSQEAITTANTALQKSNEALGQVVEKQGTKVYINGEYVPSFDATTKANQVDFDTYKANTNQSIVNLQTLIGQLQDQITALQTEINNMKNGTSVFTLLKTNTLDLV